MTTAQKGTVYLVGAGPGDPELLTLKAANLLASADVILHDDLVSREILDCAGSQARVMSVGKRCGAQRIAQEQIHTLMIQEARNKSSVVRLKSGDPLIFGRAGEEIDALEQAGIPCEVIPGVTAMFAAAAVVRKSLTDRRTASKVILTTAHHAREQTGEEQPPLWHGPLPNDATLGIYMPGRDLRSLAWNMLAQGMSSELPCVVVSQISLPGQQTQFASLSQLADLTPGPAPLLILAGWPLGKGRGKEKVVADIIQTESVQELLLATS